MTQPKLYELLKLQTFLLYRQVKEAILEFTIFQESSPKLPPAFFKSLEDSEDH